MIFNQFCKEFEDMALYHDDYLHLLALYLAFAGKRKKRNVCVALAVIEKKLYFAANRETGLVSDHQKKNDAYDPWILILDQTKEGRKKLYKSMKEELTDSLNSFAKESNWDNDIQKKEMP